MNRCGFENCFICDQIEEEENSMSEKGKHFIIANGGSKSWNDYAAAEAEAKRYTNTNQQSYYVYEAVAKVASPVPEAEVTKL